jgi:excisionase family DNA binding protein
VTQLITVEEAARMLACTPAAIRKWIFQRRLPCVKIGRLVRLRLEDVQRVAANGLPEPGTCPPPRTAVRSRQNQASSPADGPGSRQRAGAILEAPAKGS